jgi:hypothetical protein
MQDYSALLTEALDRLRSVKILVGVLQEEGLMLKVNGLMLLFIFKMFLEEEMLCHYSTILNKDGGCIYVMI